LKLGLTSTPPAIKKKVRRAPGGDEEVQGAVRLLLPLPQGVWVQPGPRHLHPL
jgi:hypothetical protein